MQIGISEQCCSKLRRRKLRRETEQLIMEMDGPLLAFSQYCSSPLWQCLCMSGRPGQGK